jgi:hypothetical protein
MNSPMRMPLVAGDGRQQHVGAGLAFGLRGGHTAGNTTAAGCSTEPLCTSSCSTTCDDAPLISAAK